MKFPLNAFALSIVSAFAATSCFAAIQDTIPDKTMVEYGAGDTEGLKHEIASDQSFIHSLFYLGHHLGYGWAGGTASQYVGKDIEVSYVGENSYSLQASDLRH